MRLYYAKCYMTFFFIQFLLLPHFERNRHCSTPYISDKIKIQKIKNREKEAYTKEKRNLREFLVHRHVTIRKSFYLYYSLHVERKLSDAFNVWILKVHTNFVSFSFHDCFSLSTFNFSHQKQIYSNKIEKEREGGRENERDLVLTWFATMLCTTLSICSFHATTCTRFPLPLFKKNLKNLYCCLSPTNLGDSIPST